MLAKRGRIFMKDRKNDAKKALAERLKSRVQAWRFAERDLVVLRGRRGATVHGCRKILQYSLAQNSKSNANFTYFVAKLLFFI
jgi:hypothetical protein